MEATAREIYQFLAKDSETKNYALCLGNSSKDFTIFNIKKNRIKRNYFFFLLILITLILTIL